MKGLIATIIILLITIFGLYIFNFNKDIFKKSNWPVELSQVPDISQFAKINSIKKETKNGNQYWYLQINNIKIKKLGEYRAILKTYNFVFLNDREVNENEIEKYHMNNFVNVYLRYNPNIETANLLLTVVLE
jgi:hypothetical protein